MQGLVDRVAQDWRKRAEGDHSINDYIGLIDFGNPIGRIQFRIIPEAGGFGDQYEPVDRCNK
ncbi:hypothetical protein GGS26DRAFT_567327 [Hypomontagnella submonticulosa]|nr:hypothetical protein GGS26DRAFT_567327 [Hypomontagnella submonticulosa]